MAWTTPHTWTTGEVVTAANMNTYVRDNLNWLYYGENVNEATYNTATLLNGFVSVGGNTARYRINGGWVEGLGLVSSGTNGATIYTLPSGYRPDKTLRFATIGLDGTLTPQACYLEISSGGNVSVPFSGTLTCFVDFGFLHA